MARLHTTLARMLVFVLLVACGIVIMNIPHLLKTHGLPRPFAGPFTPLVDSGIVPPDTLPVDSVRVMTKLAQVIDPELDVSITELGLVHELKVDSGSNVSIVMSLTTLECPYARQLAEQVVAAVKQIPGARRIRVKLDPMIPWDPSRVSDRARRKYESLFGASPDTGR